MRDCQILNISLVGDIGKHPDIKGSIIYIWEVLDGNQIFGEFQNDHATTTDCLNAPKKFLISNRRKAETLRASPQWV